MSELQKSKNKNSNEVRLSSLDIMKAVAIILVILTHIFSEKTELNLYGPFWINMAVPMFLIISGYTNAMSADHKSIATYADYYQPKRFLPKLDRVFLPYLITIAIETVVFMIVKPMPLRELIIGYCTGGWGSGSYYFPILVQLVILFPILYLAFQKSPNITVVVTFLLQLAYDSIANLLSMNDEWYRLLIFRYLVFIIMGIVLYKKQEVVFQKKIVFITLAAASFFYILYCFYIGTTPFLFDKWTETSLPTIFWAFGLVMFGIKGFQVKRYNWFTDFLCILGQASFHIFLTQMVYFGLGFGKELKDTAITIVVCCAAGIAFYYFEIFLRKAMKWLFMKIKPAQKREAEKKKLD